MSCLGDRENAAQEERNFEKVLFLTLIKPFFGFCALCNGVK